jgi:hypothetical protein
MNNNSEIRALKQNIKNAQHEVAAAIEKTRKEREKLKQYYLDRLDVLEQEGFVEKRNDMYYIKDTDNHFSFWDGDIYLSNTSSYRLSSPKTYYYSLKKRNDPSTPVMESICRILFS